MVRSNKLSKLILTVAALAAVAAITASPAAAEVVAGKFNSTTVKLATSGVTIKKNGGEEKTCTLSGGSVSGSISGSSVIVSNGVGETVFSCTGGTKLGVMLWFNGSYDTVSGAYSLRQVSSSHQDTSPWGTYTTANSLNGSWTNGSGSTNSTVGFKDALVGYTNTGGYPITLSGTFTATTGSGGLLTMSH